MQYRRHNQWVLGLVASVLTTVAAFTVAVDAVGLWGTPAIAGFNSYKVNQHRYEVTYKAAAYARRPTSAVFIGTSRVKYGLDPATYTRLTGREAYNMGVGGLAADAFPAVLAHVRRHRPDLEEVVLGLGHQEFLRPTAAARARVAEAARHLGWGWLPFADLARHTLTVTALSDAAATIKASRRAPDARVYAADGRDLSQPWIASLELSGTYRAYRYGARRYGQEPIGQIYDPGQLAWLRAMVEACRAGGVRLTVFVAPGHALEYEGAWGLPAWAELERVKRDLAAVTPYWDFSGYNAVTTEPLAARMRHYLDVTHYRPAAGDLVLQRMYGGPGVPPGFGRLVTAANVEASIAQLRAERAAWAARDPADLRLLGQLRQELGVR